MAVSSGKVTLYVLSDGVVIHEYACVNVNVLG